MTLPALDIPDDPAQLSAWLEGHLHGLNLAALIADLTAVHGREEKPPVDLARLLGDQKEAVLSDGLGVLPAETLRQFLIHPLLLLDLQELVLCDGGPYWHRLAVEADHAEHVHRGAERLQTFLTTQETSVLRGPGSRVRWYRRPWFVSLATAASLMAAFFVQERLRRHPDPSDRPPELAAAPWGWNKPDALPTDVSRSEYLNRLADGADEWFAQRPTEAAALARRIQELRAGCTRLIFAEHRPLSATDRERLIENCRIWGRKLDKEVAALESGQDALEVRAEADELIRQIIDRLHEQARKAA